jgi:osmoprotectant transport system permease protein
MSAPKRASFDRLGTLLTIFAVIALLCLPFVISKANRIVPGTALGLFDVLPPAVAAAVIMAVAVAAYTAIRVANPLLRLGSAVLAVAVVSLAVAAAGSALTPLGNKVVRIAPGAGFWLLLSSLGLMVTDAITRLRPGPLLRVALLVLFVGIALAALAHGTFDQLSVMRAYAVNAARFAHEIGQHLWLAMGSLAAAVIVALPIGVLCHRVPRLRGGVLGTLNLIQTIPAIALFGILMAPLAALAAAAPWAAALGIRGIGTAPALIALVLYSLLPIVANTVVGLEGVPPAVRDAAAGMGLTRRQILTRIDLPLALPVILTGIRVVLVQAIGLVTVAALIGGSGFGIFIFQGLGQTAMDLVLLGAVPTVVLAFSSAVILDAVVDSIQGRRHDRT